MLGIIFCLFASCNVVYVLVSIPSQSTPVEVEAVLQLLHRDHLLFLRKNKAVRKGSLLSTHTHGADGAAAVSPISAAVSETLLKALPALSPCFHTHPVRSLLIAQRAVRYSMRHFLQAREARVAFVDAAMRALNDPSAFHADTIVLTCNMRSDDRCALLSLLYKASKTLYLCTDARDILHHGGSAVCGPGVVFVKTENGTLTSYAEGQPGPIHGLGLGPAPGLGPSRYNVDFLFDKQPKSSSVSTAPVLISNPHATAEQPASAGFHTVSKPSVTDAP